MILSEDNTYLIHIQRRTSLKIIDFEFSNSISLITTIFSKKNFFSESNNGSVNCEIYYIYIQIKKFVEVNENNTLNRCLAKLNNTMKNGSNKNEKYIRESQIKFDFFFITLLN